MSGPVNHQHIQDAQANDSVTEKEIVEREDSIVKKKPQHKVEEEKSLETVKSLENHGRLSSCNMNSQRDLSVTELNRIRAKMGTYYDEDSYTVEDIMEHPEMVSKLVTTINKMWNCYQMQEQQICMLKEENERLHLHILQCEKISLKTLDIFDRHFDDQASRSNNGDKLCESGEDDSRLDQKAQLQMKQILTVKDDGDKLQPNQKKKGKVQRGLRKIKERFKSSTKVLENPEDDVVTSANSSHCSHFSSLQDNDNAHSNISEVDNTHGLKDTTNRRQKSECSQNGDYSMSHSDSIITLEDFLAESNKSSNSIHKHADTHSTRTTFSSSGGQSISSKEFDKHLQPRSDRIELPKFLRRSSPISSLGSSGSVEMRISSRSSQTGSEEFHSMSSNCSLGSDELNNGSSYNKNSSPNDHDSAPLPAHTTASSYCDTRLNQQTEQPIIKQQFSNSSAPVVKRYVPVKTSDGPSYSAPTSFSTEKFSDDAVNVLLESSSSHKDNDCNSTLPVTAGITTCSPATGKLPLFGKQTLPTNHQPKSVERSNISSKSLRSLGSYYV